MNLRKEGKITIPLIRGEGSRLLDEGLHGPCYIDHLLLGGGKLNLIGDYFEKFVLGDDARRLPRSCDLDLGSLLVPPICHGSFGAEEELEFVDIVETV